MIAGTVFLRGIKCTLWGFVICSVLLIADVIYSYRASKFE